MALDKSVSSGKRFGSRYGRKVRHKFSKIEAEQITAIYLSPQDPDYFTAAGRPVALYRYELILDK